MTMTRSDDAAPAYPRKAISGADQSSPEAWPGAGGREGRAFARPRSSACVPPFIEVAKATTIASIRL